MPDAGVAPAGAVARKLASIEAVEQGLASVGYIPNRQIATAVYLAQHLQKPILVEGPAGVGKTELAKSVAAWLDLTLIRMQCYEGLDESKALYEWKYGKQLLYTQILKDKIGDVLGGTDDAGRRAEQAARVRRCLLLGAIPGAAAAAARVAAAGRRRAADRRDRQVGPGVRGVPAGDPVRLPGDDPRDRHRCTLRETPIVLLTSNSTRDLGDALKRRCLHLHIGFPDAKLEGADHRIARAGHRGEACGAQLVAFVQQLRALDLKKVPSVSETIDWARVLVLLHAASLEVELVHDTLNVLLKFEADIEVASKQLATLTQKASRRPGCRYE